MLAKLCKCTLGCLGVVVLVVAVIIGVCVKGLPAQWGWLHCVPEKRGIMCDYPDMVGASPSTYKPEDWKVRFSEIATQDLSGQTALVTGANAGLGYWTALHLAKQGAHVMLCCRNAAKCKDAVAQISATTPKGTAEALVLDTSSLASVQALASEVMTKISSLDMLVLNAGILDASPPVYVETKDGIETVWATNHVGHFLLYKLLLPLMEGGGQAGGSRVVVVSSGAHFKADGVPLSRDELKSKYLTGPGPKSIYYKSKAANVLFTLEAARRVAHKPVYVNVLNPGAVGTSFLNDFFDGVKSTTKWFHFLGIPEGIERLKQDFMWSPEMGALVQLWLATPDIKAKDIRGRYFHQAGVEMKPSEYCQNETLQKVFWDWTEELVAPFSA